MGHTSPHPAAVAHSLLAMLGCMVAALVLWEAASQSCVESDREFGTDVLARGLVFAVAYAWVPSWFIKPVTNAAPQFVYTVLSLLYNASMAIILAVLLVAVFMQRQPASQQP